MGYYINKHKWQAAYCLKCGENGCADCAQNHETVLITGGGGYVASSTIDLLLTRGYKVVALDNNWKNTCDTLIPFIPHKNFEFVLGDITDERVVRTVYDEYKPSYIIHAAALVGFPICDKYKALATEVNVLGTKTIVSNQPYGSKLLFCSTGSVYAPGQGICDENALVDPPSHYGHTKAIAEKVVLANPNNLVYRFATAMGLSKTNMRVSLLANDLTHQSVVNKTITIFENSFFRTFIHVRDMASSIIFALENFNKLATNDNRIFNIGHTDLNITKKTLCDLIAVKTGAYVHYAEFNKDADKRDYRYDVSKIYSYGWRAQVGLEETIDELIKVSPLLSKLDKYQ